ncbi:MAG: hypothetical protein R3330_14850 [Saprospiraceae bacterium]|nr:hypothetical protein [Saprospiraceae bacterium]
MHLSFEYGTQFPAGDLQDRFGHNFNLGSQYELMHLPSGWHAGLKGYFLFGNRVKEDVLALLRTPEGDIIGNDRAPAIVFLRERGFFLGPYAGKIFRLSERAPHSGIKVSVGAGLLQHKIRIQDDTRSVSQLTGDYVKGYDRLTNGLAFYGFIGYQHLDPRGRLNFLAGFDLTSGSTQSRRDFNFDQQLADTQQRTDTLIGFRIGWILPITTGQPPNEIFY